MALLTAHSRSGQRRVWPYKRTASLLALLLMLFCINIRSADAQIATDGSVGPASVLVGPNFEIGEALDARVGGNLFHSFSRFDINAGESATFTGSADIGRVISRVTGGSPSTIDGLLRSAIPDADFYFVNPSGVMFGPSASLDIDGSFHLSTADRIDFPDGGRFSAADSANTVLSIAPPEAFGFLNDNPASITIQNSTLQMKTNTDLSLIGGDIDVAGAFIRAPDGQIQIAGVAAPGAVVIADERTGLAVLAGSATVDISNFSSLVTTGSSGGGVHIEAGEIVIDRSTITANTTGGSEGNGIELTAADRLTLSQSQLTALTFSAGDGGGIRLTAMSGALTIKENSFAFTGTAGSGTGGAVAVLADHLTIDGANGLGFTGIASQAFSPNAGAPGSIALTAGRLDIMNGATIDSLTSAGASNGIQVTAKAVAISNGGEIQSRSSQSADSGAISVAADRLSIKGRGVDTVTGIHTETNFGTTANSGPIMVTVHDVDINDGGDISSVSQGSGNAGDVTVTADNMAIQGLGFEFFTGVASRTGFSSIGHAGNVTIDTATGALLVGGRIQTNEFVRSPNVGTGTGGNIAIKASRLEVLEGGSITAQSFFAGEFQGNIAISADKFVNRGRISASSTSLDPTAPSTAGSVSVKAGDLMILDGGSIESNTFGDGDAGNVTIGAGRLVIEGRGFSFFGTSPSRIESSASQTSRSALGNAGTVEVTAEEVEILDGGQIVSGTSSRGNAGSVSINAKRILIKGDTINRFQATGILSDTSFSSTGNGGNVTISADDLNIGFGGIISTETIGTGRAGEIAISAGRLDVRSGGSISSGTGSRLAGDAGSVTVLADHIDVQSGGSISSIMTSEGNAGAVTVKGGQLRAEGSISVANDGAGSGGSIEIDVNVMELVGGGDVRSIARGSGNAGDIAVAANDGVRIAGTDESGQDSSGIFAETRSLSDNAGRGGAIVVRAPRIEIVDDAVVSSETRGPGDAGAIEIAALGGGIKVDNATVTASTSGAGDGGSVHIATDKTVTLSNDARIIASSTSIGRAGNITIEAGESVVARASTIATSTTQSDGGDITIDTVLVAHLADTSITTSVASGSGNGGNIAIDPIFIVLVDSRIIANAFAGAGGNIQLTADNLLIDGASVVSASSALGIAGTVVIEAPDADVTSAIATLNGDFLNAASQLAQQCAARGGQTAATLTAAGRGALPDNPNTVQNANYFIATPVVSGARPNSAGAAVAATINSSVVTLRCKT